MDVRSRTTAGLAAGVRQRTPGAPLGTADSLEGLIWTLMGPTLFTRDRMQAIYGVSRDGLRLYESRGLLRPALVGQVRFYTAQDRVRLEIIMTGKRFGFSLREIEALVLGTPEPLAIPAADPGATALDPQRVLEELRSLAADRERVGASIDELKALLASQ